MAPSNFKTYEAQSRLLVAVLASDPNIKLNFKAIAKHYGSDTTVSGIEHRFRPIKKAAAVVRQVVADGKDAKEFEPVVTMNEKEIQKYYGESTPLGIEFQFRSIKKDAKALRASVGAGSAPPPISSASSTPRSAAKRAATVTPRSSAKSAGVKTPSSSTTAATKTPSTAGAKRGRPAVLRQEADKDSYESTEDGSSIDYDELDKTPTKSKKPRTDENAPAPAAAADPIPIGLGANYPAAPAAAATAAAPAASKTHARFAEIFSSRPAAQSMPTPAPSHVVSSASEYAEYDDDDDDGGFTMVEKPRVPLSSGGASQSAVFSQGSSIFGGFAPDDTAGGGGMMASHHSFALDDGEI